MECVQSRIRVYKLAAVAAAAESKIFIQIQLY